MRKYVHLTLFYIYSRFINTYITISYYYYLQKEKKNLIFFKFILFNKEIKLLKPFQKILICSIT